MQRREFSQAALSVATLAGLSAAVPLTAQAQGKPPTEGTDYLLLDKPAPVDAAAGTAK